MACKERNKKIKKIKTVILNIYIKSEKIDV